MGMPYSEMFADSAARRARILEQVAERYRRIRLEEFAALELLAELRDELPTPAALATIWRELYLLDLTLKRTVHADEQRRADVVAQRRQWREWLPVHDGTQYVFIDECG